MVAVSFVNYLIINQFGSVIGKPFQTGFEIISVFECTQMKWQHRKKRRKPHQRPYFERNVLLIGQGQYVIEKAFLLVPCARPIVAHAVERLGDIDKMLKKLGRHFFVGFVVLGQFQGHFEHIEAIHGHPSRAVGLFQMPAAWNGRTAVENPNIVQPQKAAFKNVFALRVLPIDPPREVQRQFMKSLFEKNNVALAFVAFF